MFFVSSISNLKNLLFKPSSQSTIPLFRNASDLADHVCRIKGSKYEGKGPSVVALISQCLRGQRPFPEALQEALVAAIQLKADATQLENADSLLIEIKRTLKAPVSQNQEEDPELKRGSRDPYDAFLKDVSSASDFLFLISHGTGQLESPKSKIHRLANIFIEKLNLFENAPPVTEGEAVFRFYLPDGIAGDWLWLNLFKKIVANNPQGDISLDDAVHRMSDLVELDKVQVFVVNESAVCALPLLMLDCEFKARGYSFFFNEDGEPRIFKWNAKNVYMFYNLFYRRRSEISCSPHPFDVSLIRTKLGDLSILVDRKRKSSRLQSTVAV